MTRRLTRAFSLAIRSLGENDYCPTCQRRGSGFGPGSNIVEEGEEQRLCGSCGHPVDYEGVAIGRVVNGEYQAPGFLVLPAGYRERVLASVMGPTGPSAEPTEAID